ncbi:MAG: flagellar filament outer layer protein FlaA [Desulfobacterales bacterium]|nr:flagellar filament outer layer protein FlaA [Desulfobacterales bacterium]
MKRGSLLSVLLIILAVLVTGALGADELTVSLESHIIETWDGPDSGYFSDTGEPISWQVVGSKFKAEERPRVAYAMNEWPQDLFGTQPEEPEGLGVLGINGAFVRQGYNQIELIPGVGSGDDFRAKAIPLPGRVQTLDFWVWGSNYDYYVEVHFRDFQGIAHTLWPFRNENLREPGSIKFVGWKNMFITMPNYIKQSVNYKPELASLSLTKLVFTTHPAEIVSDFYIYVDHLKVLSDMHESNFDGFGLSTTQKVQEIWGSGE